MQQFWPVDKTLLHMPVLYASLFSKNNIFNIECHFMKMSLIEADKKKC